MLQVWRRVSYEIPPGLCRFCRCMTIQAPKELPRITVPQKMVRNIQKVKVQKQLSERKRKPLKFKSPLLVSCKRDEYNHHAGQTYSDFSPRVLASHGWKHKKSAADHFTLMCHKGNPALQSESDHMVSFEDLKLSEDLLQSLSAMNILTPTNIQRLAIPKFLSGQNVLCSAETGSGKTLAYLLPILEIISRFQNVQKETVINSPRAIILVPALELAEQIMGVAKELAIHFPFLPYLASGGRGTKTKLAYPDNQEMDLLISTPGVLRKLVAAGIIRSSRLQHLVLDEADTLLDDSFSSEVIHIIRKLQISEGHPTGDTGDSAFVTEGVQIGLVSATLPRSVDQILQDVFTMDNFVRVTTEHLHHLQPHVPQKFVRLKPTQKPEEIVKLAVKNSQAKVPMMIFCNKSDTSFWLSKVLLEHDVSNIVLNAQMHKKLREGRFEQFQNGECDTLICTDIASRGLDTARVQKVINYDFPLFMSDYIHRVGRVGRVSSRSGCHVTSFVTHAWDVDLLWQIETAARKSSELHNVNANIKRKIDSVVLKKFGPPKDLLIN